MSEQESFDKSIKFYLNKHLKFVSNEDPRKTVLEYLRENNYSGTKYGCGEGGCGACTILVAEYDIATDKVKYRTANSCLLPLYTLNNKQLITIEGIGNPEQPHPAQERIAKGHGSQCGFCTPGIVMSLYGLLKLKPKPSVHDIEEGFDGNLCRCTGYRPIFDCARSFAEDAKNHCGDEKSSKSKLVDFCEFKAYDPSLDIPFPSELVKLKQEKPIAINFKSLNDGDIVWLEPQSINDLLKYKSNYPNAKIIGGNTEIGIEMKLKAMNYKTFINVSNLHDMKRLAIKIDSNNNRFLEIGVNTTLTELIDNLNELKEKKLLENKAETSLVNAFLANLRWFASKQIRNFATLAGNIVTGSPISDLNPIFMANNSRLSILSSTTAIRQIEIRKFYLGYRKIDMKPDEVLLNVQVPLPISNDKKISIVKAYKQSKRRDDDIAIVNACFRLTLDKETLKVTCFDASFGGLDATTIYMEKVHHESESIVWSEPNTLTFIQDQILKQLKHISYSVVGGMPTYRRTLAVSFFTRFWYQTLKELNISVNNGVDLENLDEIEREVSSGYQDFGTSKQDPFIGSTNPHLSGLKQTTGVAKYLDDIPKQSGELYAGQVLSTRPFALIKSINPDKALALKGVFDFVSYKDVPHENHIGILKDEECFASDRVLFNGQLIGLIIAESNTLARKAASLVEIIYEDLSKPILTIEDAIESNSFYPQYNKKLQRGQIDDDTFDSNKLKDNELVFEGTCRMGGQEHFYLETQCCLVIPKLEDNEFEVFSSTQNPAEIQSEISDVLGIPRNRIVCRVKRLGGGFGGKETRASILAAAVSVAAYKTKKPIRCVLDRDLDMLTSGTRHPFMGKYKLKITKDGEFRAYDLVLYSNAGHSYDLSGGVMDRALMHCDNVYYFPNQRVIGKLCRTNLASNTAFRGFGGPQGMMITEMMICQVADRLKLDPMAIRAKNMYKPLQTTHFSQTLHDWYLPEMWHETITEKKYETARNEVREFNSKNKWKKRGLTLLPTKFGLAFGLRFLNQGAALVHIYTDGSVLISHGGVEMGQGLHTKMIQVAANTLQIPMDSIFISETSTDKVINSSATAASLGSDINGMAVQNACLELFERLKPYRDANPNGTLRDWSTAAYLDRVNLSATGFYKVPDLTFDWNTNDGNPYSYFVSGLALTLVELDLFTGDHVILSSDLYMDIGQPINFSLDIGQIEGAFMQGVGLTTLEEVLVLSSNGSILTRGPGNYKLPSFRDVPAKLSVKLLKDKVYKELRTIKSSKGVGEPPLFLGASVFFALRDAVLNARESLGVTEPLENFNSPSTCETLRLALDDSLVRKANVVPQLLKGSSEEKIYEKLWSMRP